jgi:hypothetical protein
MDVRDRQSAEREAELMQANREELVERIGRTMREDGIAQPLSGLPDDRNSLPTHLSFTRVASSFGVGELHI